MVFQVIALIIIIYSFQDYKKAFLWFVLYKIFLNTNINFLSIPGVPILTVDDTLILFFVFLYYHKKIYKKYNIRKAFPLKFPFVLIGISWLISTVFAVSGFSVAVTVLVKYVLEYIVMTFLMWRLINDKIDLAFIIKGFVVIFLFSGVYEIFEIVSQTNPIAAYEASFVSDESRAIDFGNYESDEGRGFRAKSIFTHPIGAGINFALFIIIALFVTLKKEIDIKINKYIISIALFLSVLCVIMTKSRGPYLFFVISIMAIIDIKNSKFYKYLVILILTFAIILPYIGDQLDIFKSMFDTKLQASVGGSNADMRFEQLACAVALMMQSPIYGLGFKFMNTIYNMYTVGLLGGESIWFSVLPHFGMLGIFAYIVMIIWVVCYLPIKYKSHSIFFIATAYWIVNTVTSIPGTLIYMYYLLIILIIKYKMGMFTSNGTTKICNQSTRIIPE